MSDVYGNSRIQLDHKGIYRWKWKLKVNVSNLFFFTLFKYIIITEEKTKS